VLVTQQLRLGRYSCRRVSALKSILPFMTRQLSLLLLLAALAACTAPKQSLLPAIDYERVKERKDFDTQGEQEEYRARKLFQEHYRYQPQLKFNGPISISLAKQPQLISYGRDTLHLVDVAEAYLPLFTEGTLYPTVAGMSFNSISAVKELKKATNSATRRRFTFVAFNSFTANPTAYVFEIENKSASRTTDPKTFMQGAVLTFIRRAWLML
jgi:hypothetical protein